MFAQSKMRTQCKASSLSVDLRTTAFRFLKKGCSLFDFVAWTFL